MNGKEKSNADFRNHRPALKRPKNHQIKDEGQKQEKLWALEKWKSKTRIPTSPPPRIACGARKRTPFTQTLDAPSISLFEAKQLFANPPM